MNLIQKGHRHTHRGIIGVESAIVLIAFVIVAAALAFVVLNMGFTTTQKAKTTIVSTLAEAGSSLEIEGKVIGSSYQPGGGVSSSLNVTSFPIKIAGSGDSVNLTPTLTAIKYLSNTITYDDIYAGTLNSETPSTYSQLELAVGKADTGIGNFLDNDPYAGGADPDSNDWPSSTTAFIYWTVQGNTNDILEAGEHANLAIVFAASDRPQELDTIRVEIIPPSGASLTIERQIPNITTEVVDLG
ncbi:MAG: archaellin/type IV pilin N-terminal domain-containing protein, partial [Nitrosopumilaceae archaeon]